MLLSLSSMPSLFIRILKYVIVVALMLNLKPAVAQNKYRRIVNKIDSLANIGLPKSALAEVDRLETQARQDNNAPQQIRAVIYRMTFQSYLEENALEAIISRLKTDIKRSDFPVKPVLQSLLAETYWKYYQQNRYRFIQRSRLADRDSSFTQWDLKTIISETSRLYALSLSEAKRLQTTPVSELNAVLEGDESTRYLRPSLYDLLVHRAFEFYLTEEPELTKPKLPFVLNDAALFGDSRTFTPLNFKTTDTASNYYQGVKYLQQATLFHLQNNHQEALADIDLIRLKFVYAKADVADKDSLYLSALKNIASVFSAKPISSDALVLQGQYYQGLDSLTTAHLLFKKAIATYPQSMGGKNAAALLKRIEAKEISATIEDMNMPDKPILALLNYKNVNAAKVVLYRLTEDEMSEYLRAGDVPSYNTDQLSKFRLAFLERFKPFKQHQYTWTDKGDYRKHRAEVKIDPLPRGNYVLLVKETGTNDESLSGLSTFKVSGLSYIARSNPDGKNEIRVMDRITGLPISGVQVSLSTSNTPSWKYIDHTGTTNNNGLYLIQKSLNYSVSIRLTYRGDTLTDNSTYISGQRDNSDDDPEDKTVLFTDRQIYRPGQTIYFKGLQLQTQGEKSKIMTDKPVEVVFNDVNGKQVAELQLKSNEFGTFSGSFVIPQNMLGGDVELETDDGSIEVKVEEYKRPTFQVEFMPVKENYKLNDSVVVKANVTAFSGYGLSRARVAYRIVRSVNHVYTDYLKAGYRPFTPAETVIKTDTINSDDQGMFAVKFKALPGSSNQKFKGNYTYAISADVTDASGETHSAQSSVIVGDQGLSIESYLPNLLLAKDSIKSVVTIKNLNGRPQKGVVKVTVRALQNPGLVFKNRLWSEKPDQFILSRDDFKKDFADYTYQNEDSFDNWKKLDKVAELRIDVDEEKPGIINLEPLRKQASGVYEISMSAQTPKGDTTSVTRYVNLLAQPSVPSGFNNWVIPVSNIVKPGGQAEFFVGINEKVNILMERYNGSKLLSSYWVTIENGQQSFKFPVSVNDKNAAVQFMMVYRNRVYNSYQKIYLLDDKDDLKIKLLTFRNKLQPGQKEQWKLQITNQHDQKQATEMLAGLYDASLDDITPATDWRNALAPEQKYQYGYFRWNGYDFVSAANTQPVGYKRYAEQIARNYEKLNLFDYNYYGGYNAGYRSYLDAVKNNISIASKDKQLEADYNKSAALYKKGYDISGTVTDATTDGIVIPGVTVAVNGRAVTSTNSKGMFKVRVPVNATLSFYFVGYKNGQVSTTKAAKLNVKLTPDRNSLNEVVVVGYGAKQKRELTGAVQRITIRGNSSVSADNNEFSDRVAGLQITQVGQPGADEKVVLREIPTKKSKPPVIRTNFNETAFFYPQLHTDSKGGIAIEFTIPEALTKWRFRALAHTKQLNTGYIEREIVTQKQLSISANMPRFLREGDTLTISARLANITAGPLNGRVTLQLFNALNMQPVALLQNPAEADQPFEIAAVTNKAVSFKIIIPQGLDALTYRLTAEADNYNDGEENTIPVLPNRMLVTESMPMMVRAGQTRAFNFNRLINSNSTTLQNKAVTLEYTQNPVWYAVQALPYMMEFQYECSEQIFSRYYANTIGTKLVNTMPVIKRVFDTWKNTNSPELLSNLEKNQELKATLLEETPWLRDAGNEAEQKKRIALLFDLNKMSYELQLNLEKLQKRQLPGGGFPWFAGDYADRFITQHILAGIGQLYHADVAGAKNEVLETIRNGAVKYLDDKLLDDERRMHRPKDQNAENINITEVHAWYARSYMPDVAMSPAVKVIFNNYLNRAEKLWVSQSIYEQGMIALTMHRAGRSLIAKKIITSLLETAQQSDDLGMYWTNNQNGYYWYQSPIETQCLLIELFTEAGGNNKAIDEMKIWLLRNKQTTNWRTTKATAAACYALLIKQGEQLSAGSSTEIKLNGSPLNKLKPDVKAEAGTGYIKVNWANEQVKPELGKVEITNNGQLVNWGAMYWQYLEQLDKITPSTADIKLSRKYFIVKQTDSGPVSVAVDASNQPKTGDVLKVIVYLNAGRDFEYVQLKDMRPAGTEPVDNLSAYKYQDGLYYYQVTKDVATNFFISTLNKGNYVFEYQLRVSQPGNFSTGIASVQCMYAPEFGAHSEGRRLIFKP